MDFENPSGEKSKGGTRKPVDFTDAGGSATMPKSNIWVSIHAADCSNGMKKSVDSPSPVFQNHISHDRLATCMIERNTRIAHCARMNGNVDAYRSWASFGPEKVNIQKIFTFQIVGSILTLTSGKGPVMRYGKAARCCRSPHFWVP
jgi:hypothetical protein